MPGGIVRSTQFADDQELRRVKRAAKMMGKSISAFIADAAVVMASRVIAQHEERCPACGSKVSANGKG